MTPRRLPLRSDLILVRAPSLAISENHEASAGWLEKCFALAMHLACLALFWVLVVWPLVSAVGSGQLAREFRMELDALRHLELDAARRWAAVFTRDDDEDER